MQFKSLNLMSPIKDLQFLKAYLKTNIDPYKHYTGHT